jgi:hypothetical protein
MNGGNPIPENLRKLSISDASTWQFFEQDSIIQLGQPDGRARRLIVTSTRSDNPVSDKSGKASRSHFGISMFGEHASPGSKRVEDGLYRLESLESQIQPLLDWLAVNHHDFMRLNDFSEAFSLLRWLHSHKTGVIVVDMDGQGDAIATPDRVEIDKGPRVGP